MTRAFDGAWHVREYVHDPDGAFAGVVRQRRRVDRVADDRARVVQDCEPDAALAGHALARFRGRHVFELRADGRARRYVGPAVVGSGWELGDGAMRGRGVWPELGFNFTSYAFLVAPDRQLTGGVFRVAGRRVAVICGVAGHAPAELRGPTCPGAVARRWRGTARAGDEVREVVREYRTDGSWRQDDTIVCGDRVSGAAIGFAARFGPLLEIEAVAAPDTVIEWMEVLDAAAGHLVGVRRVVVDDRTERVEVLRLTPERA